MKKLTLKFKGYDDWDRPVYEAGGRLYVDTAPRTDCRPDICTKYNNDFYGEPDCSIAENIDVEYVPYRITWD